MSQGNIQRQPNQMPSDEIDLREVFASIGRFFSSIGRGIVNFILVIRRVTVRFAFLILAFMVLGGAVGFFFYQAGEQYYKAQMVLDSRFYSYELMESVINRLNEQAATGAHQMLARELNISVEKAAKLRSFAVEPLMPLEERAQMLSYIRLIKEKATGLEEAQLDSIQNRLFMNASQFFVTTEVYDNAVLDELEKGLITYLSSKDYVARRSLIEKENLQMLKNNIEEDERKLAMLKSSLSENYTEVMRSGSNNVFLGTDGDQATKSIFEQSIDLYIKKAQINRSLLLNQEVEVVAGFTPLEKPASYTLTENIIIWAFFGLGTAYLIILLLGINKSLNQYEQREQEKKQFA